MPRALLAYPLILALAAGPLLCCCTAGRVLGAHAPAPENSPQSVPATKPVASGHSCCSHKQEKQKPATPKPAPAKPGQCPCKDGASKVQAAPTAPNPGDQLQHSRSILSHDFDSTAGPDARVSLVTGVNRTRCLSASLFPSESDLLCSHHKLRC